MNGQADLEAMARDVIDTNRYLTLGTTGEDHRSRLPPVYLPGLIVRCLQVGSEILHPSSKPGARQSGRAAITVEARSLVVDRFNNKQDDRDVFLQR